VVKFPTPGVELTLNVVSRVRSSSASRRGRAKCQRGREVRARLVRRTVREDNQLNKWCRLMGEPLTKAFTVHARFEAASSLDLCGLETLGKMGIR
jgi:hypothetical protein